MQAEVAKKTKGNAFVYRTVLAVTLLLAVLCSVLLSWSSSRTLSYSLSGTWGSADDGTLLIACQGSSTWSATCALESNLLSYNGFIQASPLTGGGWFAALESNSTGLAALWHVGKATTLVTESGKNGLTKATYTRNEMSTDNIMAAVRVKGKYIAALFLIVGTYKWLQVSLFGQPARRVRRF